LWAVSGRHCQVLSRSRNEGRTWLADQRPPLASIEGPLRFEGGDELIVVGAPLGTDVATPISNRPLAVALTHNDGSTWQTSTLPCLAGSSRREAWIEGVVAGLGPDLAAVCVGSPSDGAQTLEIAFSSAGGSHWSETCGNGVFGFANVLGSCPLVGYPQGLMMLGGHELVMPLGYSSAVDVSHDDGASWQPATSGLKLHGLAFVAMSGSEGVAWLLQYSASIWPGEEELSWSSTGSTWHDANLPLAGSWTLAEQQ
jgi:hypothetical protein